MPHAVGLVAGELGGNGDAAAEGAGSIVGIADGTTDHAHVHKDLGLAVAAVEALGSGHVHGSRAVAADVGALIKRPDARGDGNDGLLACEGAVANLRHGNRSVLGNLVVGVAGLKAGCSDHMVELPGVGRVELERRGDAADLLDVGSDEVDIVHGVRLGDVVLVVVTRETDNRLGGVGIDRDGLRHGGEVAGVVIDLKLDGMRAVRELDILDAHVVAGSGDAVQLHAVGIDRRGGVVQALGVGRRIVSDVRIKGHHVGADGLIVERDVRIREAVGRVRDDRSIAIVHSRAVVERKVIEVVRQLLRTGGLDVHTEEGGLTIAGTQRIGERIVIGAGEIRGQIDPSVFGDIGLGALVEADLLLLVFRIELEVQLRTAGALRIFINGKLHGQRAGGIAGRVAEAFRHIAPHAERGGLLAVGNVTQDILILDVEQQCIDPGVELDVAEVEVHAQRVVAVVDLAAVLSGGQEGVRLLAEGNLAAADEGLELIGFRDTVLGEPALYVLAAAVPVGDIAVLKVPENLGALAVGDSVLQLLTGGQILGGELRTGDALVGCRGKAQAVQRAGALHGGGHFKHAGIKIDVCLADLRHDGKRNRARLVRRGVRQRGGGRRQRQRLGVGNMDGLAADHIAA